jgi:glycosyltransferase involved in cell wall biosynthesis
MPGLSYVLVTAAHNEAEYIGQTIKAVAAQSILPKKWIIVSDGSDDSTDEIVKNYGRDYSFIELLHKEPSGGGFASQARALMAGCGRLKDVGYDFIGTLDADITFEQNYYESILANFQTDPKLGIAGGSIYEYKSGILTLSMCSLDSVPGAIQMFRRETFIDVGGFIPLKMGGHDAVAEAMARMHGWKVRSFPEIKVLHHRPCGASYGNTVRARFNTGIREYAYGNHPLFEFAKCLHRIGEKPCLLSSILRLSGYSWALLRREPREIPAELVASLRREQMERLLHAFSNKDR